MPMKSVDFPIVSKSLAFDDDTLIEMRRQLLKQIESKKTSLSLLSRGSNENNYLHLTVARLAYHFAIEEFESVNHEMLCRGLVDS